jgi:hypothetical protein
MLRCRSDQKAARNDRAPQKVAAIACASSLPTEYDRLPVASRWQAVAAYGCQRRSGDEAWAGLPPTDKSADLVGGAGFLLDLSSRLRELKRRTEQKEEAVGHFPF